LHRLAWHKKGVRALAFSANGKRLATSGSDGLLCLADLAKPDPPRKIQAMEKEIHLLAFHENDKNLISFGDCYGDEIGCKVPSVNTIAFWDPTTGKRLRSFGVGSKERLPRHKALEEQMRNLMAFPKPNPKWPDYDRTTAWALSADHT